MKSDLAEQLKEILDNMSQEEFDREWSKITALGFGVEGIGSESEEKNIPKGFFLWGILRKFVYQFTNKHFHMAPEQMLEKVKQIEAAIEDFKFSYISYLIGVIGDEKLDGEFKKMLDEIGREKTETHPLNELAAQILKKIAEGNPQKI